VAVVSHSVVAQAPVVALPDSRLQVHAKFNGLEPCEPLGGHEALDVACPRLIVSNVSIGVLFIHSIPPDSVEAFCRCDSGVVGAIEHVLLEDLVVVALPLGPIRQIWIGRICRGDATVAVFEDELACLLQSLGPYAFVHTFGTGYVRFDRLGDLWTFAGGVRLWFLHFD